MSPQPKRGLGRGLGALLGESAPIAETLREIRVDRVLPNPHQPRKRFEETALEELQTSIAEHGVLVPILVRECGDSYEIIAGERRWRACAALQLRTIPAIVRSSREGESLEIAIVENLQREDLNPLEEAAGIAELIESHGYTQEQVARRLGKSRPAVTNALRLLGLSDGLKAMLADGVLSAGHARALLGAPEDARQLLARRAVNEGLPVRAIERVIAALARGADGAKRHVRTVGLSADDRDFEARLRVHLGAPVALRRGAKGGTIEIRYAGEADLIRISDLLLGEAPP